MSIFLRPMDESPQLSRGLDFVAAVGVANGDALHGAIPVNATADPLSLRRDIQEVRGAP